MIRRPARLVGVCTVVLAIGGTTLFAATDGAIMNPADVSSRAFRLDPPRVPSTRNLAAVAMFDEVNAERSRRGLSAFIWNDQVTAAAQAHSVDMAANRTMQHAGTDGSNAGDRLRRQGFIWSTWGENIGAGYTTAEPMLDAWLASPNHRTHLIGNFTYVGIGAAAAADDTPYWTLVVAR